MYWLSSKVTAKLTQLENSPSSITWSPDGKHVAFSMKVNAKAPVIAKMPLKPKDAKWAAAPRITDRLKHEADGQGYIKPGFSQIFLISAEGGSPRQLTKGIITIEDLYLGLLMERKFSFQEILLKIGNMILEILKCIQ